MCKFSLGLVTGAMIGAGMIMAVSPADKRAMRRACRKTERMVRKFGNTVNDRFM